MLENEVSSDLSFFWYSDVVQHKHHDHKLCLTNDSL